MRKILYCVALMTLICAVALPALATPSTTYWTPACIDIQPNNLTRVAVYDYFGVGSNMPNRTDEMPVDVGVQWGAQCTKKLAAEFGFDVLSSPYTTPFFLNFKVGYKEDAIAKGAPAVQLGVFNIGEKRDGMNNEQDIVWLTLGHSLPGGRMRLSASGYYGNPAALRSSLGNLQNTGFMVASDYQLVPGKWVLAADYASGMNTIGGGGAGCVLLFYTQYLDLDRSRLVQ